MVFGLTANLPLSSVPWILYGGDRRDASRDQAPDSRLLMGLFCVVDDRHARNEQDLCQNKEARYP